MGQNEYGQGHNGHFSIQNQIVTLQFDSKLRLSRGSISFLKNALGNKYMYIFEYLIGNI